MKKYSPRKHLWKEIKALEFTRNFLNNHQGSISDDSTFGLVASLHPASRWIDMIKAAFPKATIRRMEDNGDCLNRLNLDDSPKEMLREIWFAPFARNRLRKLLATVIGEELKKHPLEKLASDPFAQKVRELQLTLKLSDFELDVLLVLAFMRNDMLCLTDDYSHRCDQNDKQEFIAKCLNCDAVLVREALRADHRIRRYNCVDDDLDFNVDISCFLSGISKEPLTNSFYIRCRDEALPWSFYGNLVEKHGEMLRRILSSADRDTPTNILLYGAPGTGKTSFAKTLAAELKRECYMISQDINMKCGASCSSPEHRFGALQICADQIDPADSIIIVDEADEMLRSNAGLLSFLNNGNEPSGDKGLLNSILDSVRVPTIWITNSPAGALDESTRRRFDYSIRFNPLNTAQRLAIWRNNVSRMKLGHLVGDAMQNKFAAAYPVSAGGITMTLQNLMKLSPRPDEVEALVGKLLEPHCELLDIPRSSEKLLPAKDYSLEGLNIKGGLSLDRIVDAVRSFRQGGEDAADRPRMNLLLSGAPGTGKTEFVKYLGSVLQTKVVVKMGSDLLDMYVGGTERNIRNAFEEAEAEDAILFLDEIDGLVQSRERATQSWQVSQVNELLHRMENFKGVMIGATNFAANLDAAIMRRFTFKLEFDYLGEAGKKHFFERMFRTTLAPEEYRELADIPMLTPGDFRTVRQSFFYLGGRAGNRDYIAALAHESEIRNANRFAPKPRIGF